MKRTLTLVILAVFTMFLLVSGAAAQGTKPDQKQETTPSDGTEAERGFVEFGFRTFWGEVYGRPDLPFKPALSTSKLSPAS